tara:strand:+ start:8613 stop:9044 length:432 start_codon:yes stop_codon:yes gene_type:complete
MKPFSLFLICVAGVSVFEVDAEVHADAALLAGQWRIIDDRLDTIGAMIVWEFTATEVIVRDGNTGDEVSRSRYTIDPKKSPKWITVEVDDSPTEHAGDRRLGIFRIQGGQLQLKQEIIDGAERPDQFDEPFIRFQRLSKNQSP